MADISEWMELAAQGIEVLAVATMVTLIAIGTARRILNIGKHIEDAHERYRVALGKTLLVGIELLVAADIIRTVALDNSLIDIVSLGALIVVRTFLGWTLTVEVEGRWPWQAKGGNAQSRQGEAKADAAGNIRLDADSD